MQPIRLSKDGAAHLADFLRNLQGEIPEKYQLPRNYTYVADSLLLTCEASEAVAVLREFACYQRWNRVLPFRIEPA
jgi:hypothetical protein